MAKNWWQKVKNVGKEYLNMTYNPFYKFRAAQTVGKAIGNKVFKPHEYSLPESNPAAQSMADTNAYVDQGGGGGDYGSGGGGGGSAFTPVYFNGQWYRNAASLMQAMQGYYTGEYGRQYGSAEKQYKTNLADLEQQYLSGLQSKAQERQKIETQLPEQEAKSLGQLGQYYGQIGPDVYQSSQGTSEQAVRDETQKQLADYRTQLNKALKDIESSYSKQKQSQLTGWESTQRSLSDWLNQVGSQIANVASQANQYNPANFAMPTATVNPAGTVATPATNWDQILGLQGISQLGERQLPAADKGLQGLWAKLGQGVGLSDTERQTLLQYLYGGAY